MGKYTAVIVEPRIHAAWPLVLGNFLKNLDERWDFLICCGIKNEAYLEDLVSTKFGEHKHRIQIINMNVDNYSFSEYNQLMMSKDFYEKIPTEIFLIFQLDSLVSDKYKNYIYDFLHYDYVGAPCQASHEVGNGGLSLRRKSAIIDIIESSTKHVHIEDLFFSHYAKNKPSFDDAKRFSVETVFSEESFGMHKCWNSISEKELLEVSKYIPDVFALKDIHTFTNSNL